MLHCKNLVRQEIYDTNKQIFMVLEVLLGFSTDIRFLNLLTSVALLDFPLVPFDHVVLYLLLECNFSKVPFRAIFPFLSLPGSNISIFRNRDFMKLDWFQSGFIRYPNTTVSNNVFVSYKNSSLFPNFSSFLFGFGIRTKHSLSKIFKWNKEYSRLNHAS